MNNPLVPVADALAQMLAQVSFDNQSHFVALDQALDKVLAEPIKAAFSVPGFDNSAMDGFALCLDDLEKEGALTLVGEALAGHPYNKPLAKGQCVRIMTGAVVPEGADTVVMQEQADVSGEQVRFTVSPKKGDHIRRAGEDILAGSTIFDAGHRLGAVDIGLLASLGQGMVNIYKALKVAVVSTGDELRLPGSPLGKGELYDSNRFLLKAMLSRFGAEVIDLGLVPDDPAKIAAAFEKAKQEADVLITSAGMSVGSADHTRRLLEEMGDISFWKVAIKPGKPFAFGKLGPCWFFGLPGNPVAAAVTLDQLVQPVLKKMAGEAADSVATLRAVSVDNLKKQPGRADYQRGFLYQEDGVLKVRTTGNQNSGILSSVAKANCYILLAQQQGKVASGEEVLVQPFGDLLRSHAYRF
ncbi:molybdopterin molybdotransferase MoeA [Gallaecimonas mangrovi]|uniref:molybdopterin molybdotransferase MoeA n=1 Tax=Gallaecimonas mangrovi TaxID=2291597 RepID=UPI000E2091DF|nr:gephyrin-like molybdotransferase Glp [Gallaecimonas mangrovi]